MSKHVTIKNDPIADMLSRIRNAMAVGKSEIELPHSLAKERVAKILADYGYLSSIETVKDGERPLLKVAINASGQPSTITHIARVSRPGRRVYVKTTEIPTIKHGRGIAIISTSQGVMAAPEAKAKQLGGELICEVY